MPWGVAISAAVGLYGANQQAGAAEDAANAQGGASAASIAEQRRQYDQTRQDQMPWLNAGQNALTAQNAFLNGDTSGFMNSSDYKWAVDQGFKGLGRAQSANLSLGSGGADADRIALGQGLATQYAGNYWNRLAGMAGQGQTTAQNLGGMGMGMASNIGNAYGQAASARGSAYGQKADAYSQAAAGIGGAANQWWQQRQFGGV